jgi:dTDP-4-dehydrorhamnose reductase
VNSDRCSHYDFALEAGRVLKIADSELTRLIEPVNLSALQLIANRPRYTPMRCIVSEEIGLAPLRDWRSALAEYIHDDDCHLNQ